MDNKKIGDLIANLRKKKNLTQQELGELVGVTPTAVSKWERGLRVPDIGIINDLSEILGISSTELLYGELKEEIIPEKELHKEIIEPNQIPETDDNQNKLNNPNKLKKILFIVIPIIIIISSIFIIYNNNKTYAYNIISASDEYYVEGKVIFRGDSLSIVVNKIEFKDTDFASTIIKNYEYEISTNGKHIFGYGYMELINNLEKEQSIKDFISNFNINYNSKLDILRTEIIKNDIVITLKFLDTKNNEITKEIKFSLINIKDKE